MRINGLNLIIYIDESVKIISFTEALKSSISSKTEQPVKELDYTMDGATYRKIFTKAQESTSSSPLGIYYGRCIAAMENGMLTAANTIFMWVTFWYGFALERWSIFYTAV